MAENVENSRQTTGGIAVGDKGMSGNPFEAYFGLPNGEIKTGAYDRLASVSDTLPDAYQGQSLFLRDTIEGFIREANEFYSTVMLPWAYTDQQKVTWTTWRFNKTLAGYVPHEGVSRMLTHSSATFEREITRRGLAFMIEHGFWKTAAGQEGYARNVMGIKQCIQETVNYDAMNEVLRSRRHQRKWKEDHGGVTRNKLSEMLASEVELYGCVQKDVNGFEILLIKYRQIAQAMGVKPNMIVVPPSFRIYYSKVPRERTQYWLFGPDGALRLKQGPEGVNLGTEYLFETRLLDIYDNDERGIDMLRRERTVGEHYYMQDPYMDENHGGFRSSHLDTWIYREPGDDNFRRITFSKAFSYVNRFANEDGMPSIYHEQLRNMDPFESPGDTEFGTTPMVTDDHMHGGGGGGGGGTGEGHRPANVHNIMEKRAANYYDDQPVYGRATYEAQTFSRDRDIFLYVDDDGTFQVVERLGQMEVQYFTHKDVEQHALTCAEGLDTLGEEEYNDLMAFVRSIESMPYHAAYTQALIERNMPADADILRTHITDPVLAATYGVPPIPEMVENEYGGLNLPERDPKTMAGLSIPPFTSSWPMMQTLADQGDTTGWDKAAKKAARAVRFHQKFGRYMNQVYHTSAFVDARYRSPWFQNADFLTTLWENVVTTPRPAVFLNVLPPQLTAAQQQQSVGGNSRSSSSSSSSAGIRRSVRIGVDGPTSSTSTGALASKIPDSFEILQHLVGVDDPEISVDWHTVVDEVQAAAGEAAARGELRNFEPLDHHDDLVHVLLAVARYKPSAKVAAEAQCAKARCNVRRVIRAMALEFRDRGYAEALKAVKLMKGLLPGTKDVDKKKSARSALEKILKDKKYWDPRDDKDPGAMIPGSVAEWQAFSSKEQSSVDFRALIDAKDRMLDTAAILYPIVGEPFSRSTVMRMTEQDIKNLRSKTFKSEETEMLAGNFVAAAEEFFALIRDLPSTTVEGLERILIPSGSGQRSRTRPVVPTEQGYGSGVWVRAPLSATPGFVNSLRVGVRLPLALPGNMKNANLTPSNTDSESLRKTIDHSIYKVRVASSSSGQRRAFEHTTWCRSMLRPDFDGLSKTRTPQIASRRQQYRASSTASGNDLVGTLVGRRGAYGVPQPLVGMHSREESDYQQWDTPHHPPDGAPEVLRMLRTETHRQMNSGNFLNRFDAANNYTNPLHRMIAHVYLASRNTKQQWETFIEKDCLPPGRIRLWRLWITHRMYTMIFMLGGYMTGATFYGGSNAELGDDVVSQFHYANFTFYSKAIVTTPDNIFLAEDVFFAGYVRGDDIDFIRDASDIDLIRGDHKADIIATLGPYREGLKRHSDPNPMDFTGVHHYPGYDSSLDTDNPHYVGAAYYELIYHLDKMAKKREQITVGFHGRAKRANTTSYWGHQIFYSPSHRSFSDHHIGTGHLGGKNTVGTGAAAVRNGQPKPFPQQNLLEYSK